MSRSGESSYEIRVNLDSAGRRQCDRNAESYKFMNSRGVAGAPAGNVNNLGPMRVLVTGGAGFIGSHVVEALTGAGHEVRVLDALLPCVHPGGLPAWSGDPGFEFVHGDVRDEKAVGDALRGVSAVCHLAAMVGLGVDFNDAPLYAGCNDLGTAVLLAAMARAGLDRLVLASSMVVYGEGRYSCTGSSCAESASTGHGRPRRRRRGRRPTLTRAGSSRAARAAASRWPLSSCPRTLRSGRATSTPTPSSPRSTFPPRGPGRPAGRRWRCAITTCTAPGCRVIPRTPGWRRSSAPPWKRAARRGSSRTARSDGTSSTSATWPAPPPPRLRRSPARCPRRAGHAARVQRRQRYPAHRGPAGFRPR